MTTIADGHVVEMNYTLTNSRGEVIDSSNGKEPLSYIQGKQNIIPGLEKEMTGKKNKKITKWYEIIKCLELGERHLTIQTVPVHEDDLA